MLSSTTMMDCPVGSFYINITGHAAAFPLGYVPHGNQHLTGHGVFTFHEDNKRGMDWTMQLTTDNDDYQYAVTQAHLYNLPLVPEGDSWACWGGRWSSHEYLAGTAFTTLYGITADDIVHDTWVIMIHTEGGHFAVNDTTGQLIVYDATFHETSVTGVTETGQRFNNRVPRKLTNRYLREVNAVSGRRGDKEFDTEFPNPDHFTRSRAQPFPDANDNVWIVWDDTTQRYIPSPYGARHGLTNDNIDTVEYLFYLYDDQGPEWDWGGPEGAGGGVLMPCPDPLTTTTSVAPAVITVPDNSNAPVVAPPVITPTSTITATDTPMVAVVPIPTEMPVAATTTAPVTLAPTIIVDASLIDSSPIENVTDKKKSDDKKGKSGKSEK